MPINVFSLKNMELLMKSKILGNAENVHPFYCINLCLHILMDMKNISMTKKKREEKIDCQAIYNFILNVISVLSPYENFVFFFIEIFFIVRFEWLLSKPPNHFHWLNRFFITYPECSDMALSNRKTIKKLKRIIVSF